MPSRRRTTTAAVTAKNRSRNKCPCKKCTPLKHDPTCTCPECGHNRLLTKAKRSRGGRKQDGGRVYLGMIDDESYYSPPVVAAAAAAAAPVTGPGPGPGSFPLPVPAPDSYIATSTFSTFPTYVEIANATSSAANAIKDLITMGGGTPASGTGTLKTNKNILRSMYYPSELVIT